MRRLDSLLLTGIGVLLVHQSAYTVTSLAGVKTAVSHGHLETAWLLGSLTAIGALARAITRSLRRRHYDHDRLEVLTAWIVVGYLGLESVERVANGLSATSLVGEPVFWLGLVFAPLVSAVLHWSLRTVARIVIEVVERPTPPLAPINAAEPLGLTSVRVAEPIFVSFALSRRGPPFVSSM